jgi:predicted nucleotidyltransferase
MDRTISDSPLVGVIASRIPDAPSGVIPEREQLAEVATSIALRFRPERIVLFGSRASGTSMEGSDVDLMVVMETSLRPPEQAARIRQALHLTPPFAIDVLVRTPEQIHEGLADGDFFVEDLITQGALLYEATDAGLG